MTLFKINTIEKLYLLLVLLSVLAPKFYAIDNSAIRWLLVSSLTLLFLIRNWSLNRYEFIDNKQISGILFCLLVVLTISLSISINIVESIISFLKIFTLIAVYYCVFNSLKRLKNPFIFIAQIFMISVFIEGAYTIFSFFISENNFSGISMNRNISSFSLLIKLPFILFLLSKPKSTNVQYLIKLIEIILLQIEKSLERGERVELRDVFTLETRTQKARLSRNPRTNEKVKVPEKKSVQFKMSKKWFNSLNNE